jgi:hypothetical protein
MDRRGTKLLIKINAYSNNDQLTNASHIYTDPGNTHLNKNFDSTTDQSNTQSHCYQDSVPDWYHSKPEPYSSTHTQFQT